MKALNLLDVGELALCDLPVPDFKPDEVLIKIAYAGICGSDIGRIFKTGTYHFPTVPGHEFSGVVVSSRFPEEIGKRVCVFPLLPCFSCESCKKEDYATCKSYDYYGSRRDGAFEQYLAVKRWNLVFLPDNVSLMEAAMCEPVAVALSATKKLVANSPKSVVISGAGPIGLTVAAWCRSMGVEDVYTFDIDDKKTDFAATLGVKKYTEGVAADAALEGTGAGGALATCINAVKAGGQIVLMGNPGGEVTLGKADYQNILRKQLTLTGTWNSSYGQKVNDWKDAIDALSRGKLSLRPLITHVFALDEYQKAFDMIRSGKEFYCKVMFSPNGKNELC